MRKSKRDYRGEEAKHIKFWEMCQLAYQKDGKISEVSRGAVNTRCVYGYTHTMIRPRILWCPEDTTIRLRMREIERHKRKVHGAI